MKKYFLIIPAIILGTLGVNLFFWGMCWLFEKPFDYLGWVRMTLDWLDCSHGTPLLDHYASREYEWQKAGRQIKRAIADLEMGGWFPFTMKNLNNRNYFEVQRFRYNGELYAAVTNSAINYLFRIYS